MTTRPHPAARSGEDERTRRLIEELTMVLDDRMTKAGHPYALVTQERGGTCPPRECSLRCQV